MNGKKIVMVLVVIMAAAAFSSAVENKKNPGARYRVVDTGQDRCYSSTGEIVYPQQQEPFCGQDAQYVGCSPSYRDNANGTVTDLNTGLMWQKTPDFVKRTLSEAESCADSLSLASYNDWRLPTIKELFSIADFRGNIRSRTPYLDTKYFDFRYPDTSKGWRIIDARYRSATRYTGTTMGGDKSVFGFNFADGRIKSYPVSGLGAGRQYVRCVRGQAYGKNDFIDNGDNTITDRDTGLMWMKVDSGKTMNWKQALKYAEDLVCAGYDDWRLPNVKELQSIVDYSRAPDASNPAVRSSAIDPIFQMTEQESWSWTGTTHIENGFGYYVCFGQAFSAWKRQGKKMNAHGAGAVRSDPKTGNPSQWPNGLGPQGDEIRIYNYVRCVRGGDVKTRTSGPPININRPTRNRIKVNNNRNRGPGQPGQTRGKGFVKRLDKDGDGKVSKKEFDGPKHHLDKLDRNGDGFLSEDEAPPPPPGTQNRKRVSPVR